MKKILLAAFLSVFLLTACGGNSPAEPEKKEATSKKPPKKKPEKAKPKKNDKEAMALAEAASVARREAADLAKQQNGIVVIGDSYSAGEGLSSEQSWPGILAHRLSRSDPAIPVVNLSISDDVASSGVSRIGWQLVKYNPKLIILALGSRDLSQQNDLNQVRKDLATVIRTAKANHVEVLLIGSKAPSTVPEEYRVRADEMFRSLSVQEGIHLVPDLMAPLNRLVALDPDFSKSVFASKEIQPALVDNMWPTLYLAIEQAGFKMSLPNPTSVSTQQRLPQSAAPEISKGNSRDSKIKDPPKDL